MTENNSESFFINFKDKTVTYIQLKMNEKEDDVVIAESADAMELEISLRRAASMKF